MGRKTYGEGLEGLTIWSIPHQLWNTVEAVRWHLHAWLPAALRHWPLLMMWQKTEAATFILSARVQPNPARSIVRCLTLRLTVTQNRPWKRPGEVEYSAVAESVAWYQHNGACMSLRKIKLKAGGPTNKQQCIGSDGWSHRCSLEVQLEVRRTRSRKSYLLLTWQGTMNLLCLMSI